MLTLHERATKFIQDNPARAAADVYQFMGKDLLAPELVNQIVLAARNQFYTDFNTVRDAADGIMNYMVQEKLLAGPVDLSRIFYKP